MTRDQPHDLALDEPNGLEEQALPPLRDRTAEELAAPLKMAAEKAKARAKTRVTADDVLAKRERRAAQKAESAAAKAQGASRFGFSLGTGAGVVLLVAAGVCVGLTSSTAAQSAQVQNANALQIQELEDHIDYLTASNADGSETGAGNDGSADDSAAIAERVARNAQSAADQLAAVRVTAESVAELQNGFATLLAADTGTGNGAPGQGFLDAVEHRKALAPFFSTGTYLLEDGIVYTPGSQLGLDVDEIDPRLQWYERFATAGAYSWSVISVVPSEAESPSLTDVTWLAQDDATGDLLGWATATWSKDTNSFSSLTVGTTALGDQQNAVANAANVPVVPTAPTVPSPSATATPVPAETSTADPEPTDAPSTEPTTEPTAEAVPETDLETGDE